MKLSNGKMSLYLNSLNKISNKVKGKLAYCVARNMRKLSSELIEFENIKNNYICEHGVQDENGLYSIDLKSDEYKNFLEFIKDFIDIEHDIDIFMASNEEIYTSDLTADEILSLDFMISDDRKDT